MRACACVCVRVRACVRVCVCVWAGCVEGLVEGARNNVRCVIGLVVVELFIVAWWAFFPEKTCAVGNGTLPCDWGETDPCAPVDRDTCDKMTPTEQCFP